MDKLVAVRTEVTDEEVAEGVDAAVTEIERFATAAVGEVTNSLAAVNALARTGIAAVIFHEMFGVLEEPAMKQARDLLSRAVQTREELRANGHAATIRHTPSPHTLYTTHPSAVKALVAAARDANARITIHLAEHPAERSAIEHARGPSVDWLKTRLRGVSESELFFPKIPLFDYAAALGVLAKNSLLVHLTDARPDELARVKASGAFVVLCPRSNLHIEAHLPPLLAILEAGIEPALGTDSVASNASLDVLAEARALRDRFSSVPADALVRMATWNGARALDFPALGRIAVSAAPGLFSVAGAVASDPSAFLLANVKAPRTLLVNPNAGLS